MGTLFVVGTPIGNLEDIGTRALNVLAEVDVIYCEDTRVSVKLLNNYGIKNRLESFHAQSDERKIHEAIALLEDDKNIALISDAGTPTISDPGSRLVSAAHDAGIPVIAIPGPSAVTAALSASGLPASDFLFLGFLPHKKGRQTLMKEIAESKRTVVFYESPHRLIKALDELSNVLDGDRIIVVSQELTKIHETNRRGTITEIKDFYSEHEEEVKGEFVILVHGQK